MDEDNIVGCPDDACLTKGDVKKFFNNAALIVAAGVAVGLMVTGMVTTLDHFFDWLDKPSETQLLRQEVRDLRFQQDNQRFTVYWSDSDSHIRNYHHVPTTDSEDASTR